MRSFGGALGLGIRKSQREAVNKMMSETTRRTLLKQAGNLAAAAVWAAPGGFNILRAAARKTDIRVEDVSIAYEEYKYRAPIKFGGHVVDRATLLNVNCSVRTGDGRAARGFGSMPLGNIWSLSTGRSIRFTASWPQMFPNGCISPNLFLRSARW